MTLTEIEVKEQSISGFCSLNGSSVSYRVCCIYGYNYAYRRLQLWEEITRILQANSQIPSIFLGDFNAIITHSERRGGTTSWPVYMNDLNNCMEQNRIEDLRATGLFFTWQNNNEAYFIQRKIDIVMSNDKWLNIFANSSATFLTHSTSDHTPMVVELNSNSNRQNFQIFQLLDKGPRFLASCGVCMEYYHFGITYVCGVCQTQKAQGSFKRFPKSKERRKNKERGTNQKLDIGITYQIG